MSQTNFNVPILVEHGVWLDWRSNYPGGFGWRGDRPLTSIRKIVIHHTVTEPSGSAKADVDLIKQIHVNSNGWGGIGYHFLITSEIVNGFAKVAYVGDIGSIRAHAPDSKGVFCPFDSKGNGTGNYYFLGISIIGKLHEAPPTPEQLRSLHELCKELVYAEDSRLPLLKTWDDIIGHWDVDPTACPGNKWDYKQIKNFAIPNIPIVKEDPVMIKELEAKIEELQSQSQAKDNVIENLQKQLAFSRSEADDLRKKSSEEFMLYKNESDAKYNSLKQGYEKLVNQMSNIDGNEEIAVLNSKLKEENSFLESQVKELQQKIDDLEKDKQETVEAVNAIPSIVELDEKEKKTIGDIVDKNKRVSGLLDFFKKHPTIIAKGSAYGSLALLVADIAVNLLSLEVPSDWTIPSITAFIGTGIAVSYGVWLRNKNLFEKKILEEGEKQNG